MNVEHHCERQSDISELQRMDEGIGGQRSGNGSPESWGGSYENIGALTRTSVRRGEDEEEKREWRRRISEIAKKSNVNDTPASGSSGHPNAQTQTRNAH